MLGVQVTCPKCKVPMMEVKGHVYHKQRKWKCPKCGKARMQKQKEKFKL
jgi:transposase-like protein